jgi:hypothetical protein
LDDLFQNLPREEAPAPAPADEPAPGDEPAEPAAPAGDAFDDLFGPAPEAPAEPAPAAEEPAPAEEAEPADPFADPFSTVRRELPLRKWTDDTGRFQIEGRLLVIFEGKVRILKPTGRTTTVPFERLSQEDVRYVEQAIAQYGHGPIGRVAIK